MLRGGEDSSNHNGYEMLSAQLAGWVVVSGQEALQNLDATSLTANYRRSAQHLRSVFIDVIC